MEDNVEQPGFRDRFLSLLTYAVIPLLIIAGVLLYRQFLRKPYVPPAGLIWVYDLNSGDLSAAPSDAAHLPPFETASGASADGKPAGVWASVFACGSCTNPADRFVGWLETLTPELRDELKPVYQGVERPDSLDDLGPARVNPKSRFIADVVKKEWHESDSAKADAVRRAVKTRCGAKPTVACGAVK